MKKINVLQVGSDIKVRGGIATVINTYINYKWDDEITINYLITHREGSILDRLLCFIYALIKFPLILCKNNIQIVHIHMSENGSFYRKYIILKLSKLFRKKAIIHMHGAVFHEFYDKSNQITKNMIKNLLNQADQIIVLGESWKEFVIKVIPTAKVKIAGNPVKINESYKNIDKVFNIIFIGFLEKRKGVDTLIKSIPYIDVKNIDVKIWICGDGPERENLEQLSHSLNVDDKVKFLGWIDSKKKNEILKDANVLVFPSQNEGLPMAILESLSYGVPVITTNVGSISDVIRDGYNGYFIEVGDFKRISEYINGLLLSKSIYNFLSKNSITSIRNNYDNDQYFKNIKDIYNNLVRI